MKTDISFSKILLAFFAFIGVMIAVRFIYSDGHGFVFLIWNLFLAWIPFAISASFKKMRTAGKWKQVLVFAVWLIFFPNALYIVTDLLHIDMETTIPKWYDVVLLFTSSITGLIMAFVSLLRVEKYLSYKFSNSKVHVMMIAILFISSFGVYLGRFLRWNSWNIISDPVSLLYSIAQRFIFPFHYLQTWGITLMLTTLFYLLYLVIRCQDGSKPSDT
ncbi:DUF1361 domain-containing protein [Ferruginibacter sp. SUN106]|uniref:DUF1361 domain-containing protein n=1 Tax=Ferruginibacter sp. SUN106 TaxID=2978348 RepID=UPI003D35BD56